MICTKCKADKPESEFYYYNNAKRPYWYCKSCHATKMSTQYQKCQNIVNKIKVDSGCIYCSIKDRSVLEFHHIDKINKSCVHKITSVKRALKEISKCEVVCANCHCRLENGEKLIQVQDMLIKIASLV